MIIKIYIYDWNTNYKKVRIVPFLINLKEFLINTPATNKITLLTLKIFLDIYFENQSYYFMYETNLYNLTYFLKPFQHLMKLNLKVMLDKNLEPMSL